MSKYLEGLKETLGNKNITQITKQLKAESNLSEILKKQREVESRLKVRKDIQKMLSDRFG